MILAHRLASGQDPFDTIRQNFFAKNGAETDAGSRIQHIRVRPDSGCTLAVMAITGRNQNASGSDPACLLGYDIFTKKMPESVAGNVDFDGRFEGCEGCRCEVCCRPPSTRALHDLSLVSVPSV